MRPPDFARLTTRAPTLARLVGVGLDCTASGVVQVALLIDDKEPRTLMLPRSDAVRLLDLLVDVGSIPARAGEPAVAAAARTCQGVHPRASGGARAACARVSSTTGPSPRERGSPCTAASHELDWGSIPARAGEPRSHPLAACT